MKLIKILLYLIIIVLLLVIFTPLNMYYGYLAKQLRPIKLEHISGSAIKGSAQKVSYLQTDLGKANWFIYPNSYNALTLQLNLNHDDYNFSAELIKSPHLERIQNLQGAADWQLIDSLIPFKHGQISGYLQFDFKHLQMSQGVVEKIVGKVVTKELTLLEPVKKDLGQIEVVFADENPEIMVGLVNSQSNVLNVSGAIYIHKNHRWEVKLTLTPYPGEYEIEYALQNIGDPRPSGGRSLNLAGFY